MFDYDSLIRFIITEAFALLLLAFLFRKPLLEEKKNVWLKLLLIMLAMYLASLFFKLLNLTYFFRRFAFSTERMNLIPFRVLGEWLAHPLNFFGNVVLFMPLGIFEVLLHPTKSRGKQLMMTVATSAAVSLVVEFAQCFNYRVPDVDDIILNTIGGLFGALLCMLMQRIGFDRTRFGRVLLPRIPRSWNRYTRLNLFCIILVVTIEVVLFTANYIVTIPKPMVREYKAETTETITLGDGEDQTAPAAQNIPEPAATAEPETQQPAATPEPETQQPAVTPEPAKPAKQYDTADLSLEAKNVLLVRLSENRRSADVIYAADSQEAIYPASTLKMLTALTVLDIADPDEKVQLGTEVYIPPLDAARAGLEPGMTMTVRDLLEGLLLPSGADAAYALGVYCGRQLEGNDKLSYQDAVKAFVAEMNRKAEAIGARNTTAVNVVGLDDNNQKTTTEDILRIAKVFLDQPLLAEICGLPKAKITSDEGKSVSLKNTNKMLISGSDYYNDSVAGVKTGTTSKAGNCLVSFFTVQGEEYICIVMNSSYDGKFTDTQALYEVCAGAR